MFVPFKEDKKSDMWLFIFDESVGVRRQTEVRKFRFWKNFQLVNMFTSSSSRPKRFFQEKLKRLPQLDLEESRNLSHFSNT